MKNGFVLGMALVAVAATAIGWLLADKRVVLIVASDSSEITVNPASEPAPAPTPKPALALDPIPLKVDPVEAPSEQAPVELAEPTLEAVPEPALEAAPPAKRSVEPAPEAEATALAKADASEAKPETEEPEALKADQKPKRPVVTYDGIGRLGHVALTAVPVKKKKGRRTQVKTPSTFYPHGRLDFDEAKLARVMKGTDDDVMGCYARTGRAQDAKVMAELTVTPEGKVHTAAVSDSTVQDKNVERCVRDVVQSLVFPKGTTSKPARVTYYWELTPSGA